MSQILQLGICEVTSVITGRVYIRGVPVYNLSQEPAVLIISYVFLWTVP
jgi:hypothetical protein